MIATRTRHGWVHMFTAHRPTLTLQLHNFDLFRTCRTALLHGSWQDLNWHDALRGPSAIAELLVVCYGVHLSLSICHNSVSLYTCSVSEMLLLFIAHVASLRAGFMLMIYWTGFACMHLKHNSCRGLRHRGRRGNATPICCLCRVARAEPSTSRGPTCNIH